MLTRSRMLMYVAWPAFLAACVLELLVFALVDPHELYWFGSLLSMSRMGVYTLAFFAFWIITAATCTLSVLLSQSSAISGRDAS